MSELTYQINQISWIFVFFFLYLFWSLGPNIKRIAVALEKIAEKRYVQLKDDDGEFLG